MPDFSYEHHHAGHMVVGVDEAGCGPWAGPVVAGAVVFLEHKDTLSDLFALLDDSKKMTEKKREKAFDLLMAENGKSLHIGIGQASVQEIDELNIRQAAMLSMKRAVEDIRSVQPTYALIDGISAPDLSCPTQTIKQGDGASYSIAAASIIAKVTRDRIMKDLAEKFPAYSWEKNAGYGTKAHQEGLARQGVTVHHRRSFAPIARLLVSEAA